MSYETITYEVVDRVARLAFNRPERLNAMNMRLCEEVRAALAAADADADVRVVVVSGAGGRAFSAGYDLDDPDDPVGKVDESGGGPDVAASRDRLNHDLAYTYSPWNCGKPVIAMINGHCLAGALEFAQMCDIRYASEDARFGVVETRFATGIATLAMPWIVGARCREPICTGDTFDAAEALRIGLVNKVFPTAALERETMKVAHRIAQVALACLQWNKRAINNAYETMGFRAAMQYGVEACSMLDCTPTPEFLAFDEVQRRQGLRAAVKWRDARFARYE